MVEIFSLVTAFLYAVSNIAVRKGLSFGSNSTTAAVTSLVVTFVVFIAWVLALHPIGGWNFHSLPYYFAAGILAPGLFRFFLYGAISRVGVNISSVPATIYPLIAVATAMVHLGERLTAFRALGMALAVSAVLLAAPKTEKRILSLGSLLNRGILLALAAAVVRGVSETMRKGGLIVANDPIFGAAMSNAAGFLFSVALLATSKSTRNAMVYEQRSFLFFLGSGLLTVGAWVFGFYALSTGEVVRVAPIVGTVPLFTVLLSALLLRGLEVITPRIVLASLLAGAGVGAMNLGS